MSLVSRIVLIVAIVVVAGFFVLRWLIQQVSATPGNLGVDNGRLSPCPESPNCVSSFADDEVHGMAPIPYEGDTATARDRILTLLQDLPRVQIITTEPNYIHAEFRSNIWRFIDDVEFYFPADERVIHFRSASRLGYGDGGVNRARMEMIRGRFLAA